MTEDIIYSRDKVNWYEIDVTADGEISIIISDMMGYADFMQVKRLIEDLQSAVVKGEKRMEKKHWNDYCEYNNQNHHWTCEGCGCMESCPQTMGKHIRLECFKDEKVIWLN